MVKYYYQQLVVFLKQGLCGIFLMYTIEIIVRMQISKYVLIRICCNFTAISIRFQHNCVLIGLSEPKYFRQVYLVRSQAQYCKSQDPTSWVQGSQKLLQGLIEVLAHWSYLIRSRTIELVQRGNNKVWPRRPRICDTLFVMAISKYTLMIIPVCFLKQIEATYSRTQGPTIVLFTPTIKSYPKTINHDQPVSVNIRRNLVSCLGLCRRMFGIRNINISMIQSCRWNHNIFLHLKQSKDHLVQDNNVSCLMSLFL